MSKKIVEYKLLDQMSVELLNEYVNECLKDGWEIYGNHKVTALSGAGSSGYSIGVWCYTQTMVKYEDMGIIKINEINVTKKEFEEFRKYLQQKEFNIDSEKSYKNYS